ncbi:MAG: redoxin domain-containing protein [Armatimonadetes bacterium]|nr:redoxin domain-containing protein [Armatimonadota bacterium]
MPPIKAGNKTKDFMLKDQHNKEFRLLEVKNKKILLSFHPLAWTKICAKQMDSLEKNYLTFKKLNILAFGISVDTVPSKHAWAKELKIKNTRLLSDFWPHGNIAKLFGIFRDKEGFSERANIIIDEKQIVRFIKIYQIPQLPNIEEIIKVIDGLK